MATQVKLLILDPDTEYHRVIEFGEVAVDASGEPINTLNAVLAASNDANGQQIKNLGAPTDDEDAATKLYVDSQISANNDLSEILANGNDAACQAIINLEGVYFCGSGSSSSEGEPIHLFIRPTDDQPQRMEYDAPDGHLFHDAILMSTNKIRNLGDPTLPQDAATKKYVDDEIPDYIENYPTLEDSGGSSSSPGPGQAIKVLTPDGAGGVLWVDLVTTIEDSSTGELTTSKVLQPDGSGGVQWNDFTTNVEGLTTTELNPNYVLQPDGAGGLVWRGFDPVIEGDLDMGCNDIWFVNTIYFCEEGSSSSSSSVDPTPTGVWIAPDHAVHRGLVYHAPDGHKFESPVSFNGPVTMNNNGIAMGTGVLSLNGCTISESGTTLTIDGENQLDLGSNGSPVVVLASGYATMAGDLYLSSYKIGGDAGVLSFGSGSDATATFGGNVDIPTGYGLTFDNGSGGSIQETSGDLLFYSGIDHYFYVASNVVAKIGSTYINLEDGYFLQWNDDNSTSITSISSVLYISSSSTMQMNFDGGSTLDLAAGWVRSSEPFQAPDGTSAAPAYSFTSDGDTGLYRYGANQLGVAASGRLVCVFFSNGTIEQVLAVNGGQESLPDYSFLGDPDTGMYSGGANRIDFATSGTTRLTLTTSQLSSTVTIVAPLGSAGTPSLNFGSPDTGLYAATSSAVGIAAYGVEICRFYSPDGTAPQVQAQDGDAADPTYSFVSDDSTGMYRAGSGMLGFSASGTQYARLDIAGLAVTNGGSFFLDAGTVIDWNSGSVTLGESSGELVPNCSLRMPDGTPLYYGSTSTEAVTGGGGTLGLDAGTNMQFTINGNYMLELAAGSVTIGAGVADVDYTLTFNGETNDGVITWMEDEDYFQFSDSILMLSTEPIYFNTTAFNIYSDGTNLQYVSSAGHLFTGDVSASGYVETDDAFYLGDPDTDGSWRVTRSDPDLVFERRDGGVWSECDRMIGCSSSSSAP